jgi:hypothetical protein
LAGSHTSKPSFGAATISPRPGVASVSRVRAAGGIGGWLMRVLWEAQKALQADLAALERRLPEIYGRRDDIAALSERLRERAMFEGRSLSNLCAYLLEVVMAGAQDG